MKLHKRSWLVRWTYFLSYETPPCTTLCAIFWRAFVVMPLYWLMISVAVVGTGSFMFVIVRASIHQPAISIPVIIVVSGYIYVCSTSVERKIGELRGRIEYSVFWQGARSLKERYCPIVTIEDEA